MRLIAAERASLAGMDGLVDLVVRGDFVAVVATTADIAGQAARRLAVRWAPPRPADTPSAPAAETVVHEHGDTSAALNDSDRLQRRYRWPTLPPADDTGATATAWLQHGQLQVWATLHSTRALAHDIAALAGLPVARITVITGDDPRLAAGRSPWAAHAAADAALLALHLQLPVQVHLGAAELRWAAAQADAQENRIEAALGADGAFAAYRYTTLPPARLPQSPALRLAGVASPTEDVALPATVLMPPYRSTGLRLASHAPQAAAGRDAGDASLAGQVFAQESFIDEAARAQGSDPADYRLRHLDDERGAALLRKVAESAGPAAAADGLLRGRGVACAHVIDSDELGTRDAWAAWLAEIAVDPRSGEISVRRVVVGNDIADTPVLDTPDLRAAIAAATGQLLTAPAGGFDRWPATAGAADEAPAAVAVVSGSGALSTRAVPPATTRDAQPQLAASAATLLPAAAAVANAIHDATGVRLDAPPFTAERIRLALEAREGKPAVSTTRRKLGWLGAAAAAAAGVIATALPLRAPIAPITPPPADLYSAATLERGRLVAAAGDCAVCHTAADGVPNAGGLALETPFGTVFTTNITPDPETGIGNWSYAAFERAMREGIHRDGRHLYPAFPYTAFARMSDADMQALYAYLMAQTPVKATAPKTELAFPYNLRPLLAGWNTLFHKNDIFRPDPTRSAEWNRGAYLVEGAGHCGACHTPRNALGAEKTGEHRYGGGFAEGWEAPPLNALSHAPVPWTEAELYAYLRNGYSPLHGVASGPMAPVVESLAALPDSDVRAIASYLASFQAKAPDAAASAHYANAMQEVARKAAVTLAGPAEALYDGACAACHQDDGPALFGVKPALALNTNLHSPHADNLVQVILHGIQSPAHGELGYMPGFADSLDDRQVAELAAYLRARFAPDKPAWPNLDATVQRLRAAAH